MTDETKKPDAEQETPKIEEEKAENPGTEEAPSSETKEDAPATEEPAEEPKEDVTAVATADPNAEESLSQAKDDETDEDVEDEDEEDEDEQEGEPEEDKLDQEVVISDVGPCKKHVKVAIARESIDELLDSKFSELMKDAFVPGFRKGKVPRRVIERQFHKDVTDQVKGELLMASLEQLGEDYELSPLAPPNINPQKIEVPRQGPLEYEFDIEVRPDFELPDYKGLKLKRPVRTFTEKDIDREQRRILAPYGQIVPKEDAPVAEGDYITVNMKTYHQGNVIGANNELVLRVDNRLAFKDGVSERFAEQVAGANIGDTRTVEVSMSSQVANEMLVGQTVTAELEILDIKTIRLPELTHEFLHEFECHSVDQLREQILVLLERRLEYEQRRSARKQLIEYVDAQNDWEMPKDMLARQARSTLRRRVRDMQDSGMSDEDINARLRLMEHEVLETTQMELKEHFVLQKIAEVEKIEVSEEEIDQEIDEIAAQAGESVRKVRAQLERENEIETLQEMIREQKALDLVLENAEYEDEVMDKSDDVGMAEGQAVEGEMRDPAAEAEEEAATTPE